MSARDELHEITAEWNDDAQQWRHTCTVCGAQTQGGHLPELPCPGFAVKNADRELYREPKGDLPSDYYANSVHVTTQGGIAFPTAWNVPRQRRSGCRGPAPASPARQVGAMGLDDMWCLCECDHCQPGAHYDIYCEVDGTHPPDGSNPRWGRYYRRKTPAREAGGRDE